MQSPEPQNDPDTYAAGVGEELELLEEETAQRVHRTDSGDEGLDDAALSGDDLAELDEDDLKDMEGPDA